MKHFVYFMFHDEEETLLDMCSL